MNLVKRTRPKRFFYANNVNMGLSFDSLTVMANKMLGAEIEVGDILICDNHRKDKRKVLQKTPTGYMIYYGRLENKNHFRPVSDRTGLISKESIKGVL